MKISLLDDLLNSPRAMATTLVGLAIVFIAGVPSYYGLQPVLDMVNPGHNPIVSQLSALLITLLITWTAFIGHKLQRPWLKAVGHGFALLTAAVAFLTGSVLSDLGASTATTLSSSAAAQVTQLEQQLANKEGIEAQALGTEAANEAYTSFLALSATQKTSKGAPIWNATDDCMRPGSYTSACAKLQAAHDKVRVAQRIEAAEITASLNAQLTEARKGVVSNAAAPQSNKLAIAAQRFVSDPSVMLVFYTTLGIGLAVFIEALAYTALFIITLSPASDGPAEPQHFDIPTPEPAIMPAPVTVVQAAGSLQGFDQDWFISKGFTPQGALLAAQLFASNYASGVSIAKRSTQAQLKVGRDKLISEVLEPLVACGLVAKTGDDYSWALKSVVEELD